MVARFRTWLSAQGVARGARFPGLRMTAGSVEKSQQYHKYFLQYYEFASERPQVRTWGRQTCAI